MRVAGPEQIKEVHMGLITWSALPVSRVMAGEDGAVYEALKSARERPVYFALECAALAFMLLGIATAGSWAFELGRAIGKSI